MSLAVNKYGNISIVLSPEGLPIAYTLRDIIPLMLRLNLRKHIASYNTSRNVEVAVTQYLASFDINELLRGCNWAVPQKLDVYLNLVESYATRYWKFQTSESALTALKFSPQDSWIFLYLLEGTLELFLPGGSFIVGSEPVLISSNALRLLEAVSLEKPSSRLIYYYHPKEFFQV